MMRFVTIRPLMVGYGLVLALLLIVGLLVQRVPPPIFLLGFSSAVICFWCAASPEFTPIPPAPSQQPQQRNRASNGSAFLRDSPPQV
jgi:fatty acid desaturase